MNENVVMSGAIALFAVAGLAFLVFGLTAFRRRRSAWAAVRAVFGLVLVGCGAVLFGMYPHVFNLVLSKDADADPARLAELRGTDLTAPAPAPPGEWPQWRGPNRDGVSAETGLLSEWPAGGPTVGWRQPVKGGYSSPAVASGRVFVTERDGGREVVRCLDAAAGRQ